MHSLGNIPLVLRSARVQKTQTYYQYLLLFLQFGNDITGINSATAADVTVWLIVHAPSGPSLEIVHLHALVGRVTRE